MFCLVYHLVRSGCRSAIKEGKVFCCATVFSNGFRIDEAFLSLVDKPPARNFMKTLKTKFRVDAASYRQTSAISSERMLNGKSETM